MEEQGSVMRKTWVVVFLLTPAALALGRSDDVETARGDDKGQPRPNSVEWVAERLRGTGFHGEDALARIKLMGVDAIPELRRLSKLSGGADRDAFERLIRELERWPVSESCTKDGITFTLSITNVLDWPHLDASTDAGVRLTITNKRNRKCYIDLVDTLSFDLRGPDGLATPRDIGRNGTTLPLPPMSLECGQSKDITLFHSRLEAVKGDRGVEVWLAGNDLYGGWWKFRVLNRGEYRFGVKYSNTCEGRKYTSPDYWVGETDYLYVRTAVR
jgi:hypothetical protein